MNSFSLSYKPERIFPTSIKDIEGDDFPINADFRNILKIYRLIDDDDILPLQKPILICKFFYPDGAPNNGLRYFFDFANPENGTEKTQKQVQKQFCYEFDADTIYSSFLKSDEYAMDLFDIPFLHWYKFQTMLLNLSERSPFMKRIQLRFADLKDYKGKDYMDMCRAKKEVQIPIKYTNEERKMLAELDEKLRS